MGFWGYCCKWGFEHLLILSSFFFLVICRNRRSNSPSRRGRVSVWLCLCWSEWPGQLCQASFKLLHPPRFQQNRKVLEAPMCFPAGKELLWRWHRGSVLRTSGLLGKFDLFKNRFIFCGNYWYLERQLVRRKKILHFLFLAELCQLSGELNLLELPHSLLWL